jgi:hypothetical protein
MRRDYPPFGKSATEDERLLNFMVQERKIDLLDFNNLPERFITGRRRINRLTPTSSTDVSKDLGDQPGDVIIENDFVYILVDIGGNVFNWKRIALISF